MDTFAFTDDEYWAHVAKVERVLDQLRHDGTDSRALYARVLRGWTLWSADRRSLQRALVHDLWEEHAPAVPREGIAFMVAGVAGAGKTTVRSKPENGMAPAQFLILDPEEIETAMAERRMIPAIEGLSPMEASPLVHEEAWEITNRLAQMAYREKCNVVWEMPMNSADSSQHLEALKAFGYSTKGGFVDADVDTARDRTLLAHRRGEEAYRSGHGFGGRLIPRGVHESCRPDATPEVRAPRSVAPGLPVRALVEEFEQGAVGFDGLLAGLFERWHARSRTERDAAGWVEVYRRCEKVPDDDALFWINVAEDSGTISTEQAEALFASIESTAGG